MKAQIDRKYSEDGNEVEVSTKVEIWIGDTHYTLQETIDGHLEIMKYDHLDTAMSIFPRVTNKIEIK